MDKPAKKDPLEDMKPRPKPVEPSDKRKRFYIVKLNQVMVEHFANRKDLRDAVGFNAYGEIESLRLEDTEEIRTYQLFKRPSHNKYYYLKQTNQSFRVLGNTDAYFQPMQQTCVSKVKKPKLVLTDEVDDDQPLKRMPLKSRDKGKVDKRVRMDENQLKNKIFEMFSKKEAMTFQEINTELDQPDQYLKTQLDKLCDLVASPPLGIKEYRLKADFK
ncbi:hypothetical protein EIN_379950 [Entamoeba invadens IP1]|uniref:TFIIF beta subunit HTH domain-containing protein n=1 Tax=Entamoeba invadens IP1 TaxID=370355 RepID=A0A0A1UAK5_ENTIV|nr:hypothetical protein EIN_379950 [Entamoeba invadens IP1]ELP92098.1 hypothetical protein EIN_379950 [Entamoeba invadens IP1]|eukprot:XP_004258869.1 hypothetical protein EIN_379950 [Entamoeba invadens IP1]